MQYSNSKTKLIVFICFTIWCQTVSLGALAQSPPNLPLPICEIIDGTEVGACLNEDLRVSASIGGDFAEGAAVQVQTIPDAGICIAAMRADQGGWAPAPCFAGVSRPSVGTCGVIDLLDGGKFKEMSCTNALYTDSSSLTGSLFTVEGVNGNPCGGSGNFQTYAYGGPANVPGARWSEFGPSRQICQIVFNGPRPDGLFGPTWVKVIVGTSIAVEGDDRSPSTSAQTEVYVPIDGDMREGVIDLDVLATNIVDGMGDDITATYTATISNIGTKQADDVVVTIELPEEVHFESVSDSRCEDLVARPLPFIGGTVRCTDLSLAGNGSGSGNDVLFIDVVTRITNATDLKDNIVITATVAEDIDTSNNQDSTRTILDLSGGSVSQTRQEMRALDPYFNYEIPSELLDLACDAYMNDIYTRLQAIQVEHPEAFEFLSFGRITSGDYFWFPGDPEFSRAGHVGVIVYMKGTDYRQTGVIIHGTPTWSPFDLDLSTQVGADLGVGEHVNSVDFVKSWFGFGTQGHGMYYRTPLSAYPGSPIPENPLGCGFEGVYQANVDEFANSAVVPTCVTRQARSCPILPDAVIIESQSPVDILLTNPQSQQIQTQGGIILEQQLEEGIHSFATLHDDGSYGWLLVLPKNDYDIQLTGTAEGTYTLTTVTFNENGEANESVFEGSTALQQISQYQVIDTQVPESPAPPAETPNNGSSSGSGSGSNSPTMIVALLLIVIWRRMHLRQIS